MAPETVEGSIEVFHEIVDFFLLKVCSKPIFCSKNSLKGKSCSSLLKPQTPKFAKKLPNTIRKGLVEVGLSKGRAG